MRVRYTLKALAELDQIYSFIESKNPRAAKQVNARIKRAIETLGRFPYIYRETDRAAIRVMPILRYPYLVFYSVDDATQEVCILRIRHAAQDPTRHLD